MENTELLNSKLELIDRGSHWFRVVGIFLVVWGILSLVATGLRLLPLLGGRELDLVELAKDTFSGAGTGVMYLALSYMSFRAQDAFQAIAALIRENEGII